MKAEDHGGEIVYSSVRKGGSAEFRGRYGPRSAVGLRRPGSLEHWLSERYCLYTVHRETLYRGEIHHAPWPLQEADAEIDANTMASSAGIVLPDTKPLLHFAKRLDVLIWPLKRAS
jgi:uncharacterized protein YqjF (DUF2071 family)